VLHVLRSTPHHGFPVVDIGSDVAGPDTTELSEGRFEGLVLRSQLIVLLKERCDCSAICTIAHACRERWVHQLTWWDPCTTLALSRLVHFAFACSLVWVLVASGCGEDHGHVMQGFLQFTRRRDRHATHVTQQAVQN
jgi:hypothetical protein